MTNPLIVIIGPTASGKTSLALDLAEKFNGEIVNADSQNIYREMDIGTAKATLEEQARVKHHLLDVVDPDQDFNVATYKKMANESIAEIHGNHKVPFLVGGTGLYIDSVVYNFQIPHVLPDFKLRVELASKTRDELLGQLEMLDPEAAATIDPDNKRRIVRAIEITQKSGLPLSAMRSKGEKSQDTLLLGVDFHSREDLYKRIELRVDQMIQNGFLEEFKELADHYPWNIPGFSALGYRQLSYYFRNEVSLEQAVESIKIDTRRYAKRQLTWFKRNKEIVWIKSPEEADKLVANFLRK